MAAVKMDKLITKNSAIVEMLIQAGADVNAQPLCCYGNNITALMYAALGDNDDMVRMLLQAGADVNAFSKGCFSTALMYAAVHGHLRVMQTLIDAGANVNAKGRFNETVLSMAKGNWQDSAVQLLLKAGAVA